MARTLWVRIWAPFIRGGEVGYEFATETICPWEVYLGVSPLALCGCLDLFYSYDCILFLKGAGVGELATWMAREDK